jgi:hypothetical protein
MKMAAMNTAEETWTGMTREPAQARATFAIPNFWRRNIRNLKEWAILSVE